MNPLMEYLVLYSNGEQLLIFVQNLKALFSIFPSSVLDLSELSIQAIDRCFLRLATKLLSQGH